MITQETLVCVDDLPKDAEIQLREDAPGYDELLTVLADITFNPKHQDLDEGGSS